MTPVIRALVVVAAVLAVAWPTPAMAAVPAGGGGVVHLRHPKLAVGLPPAAVPADESVLRAVAGVGPDAVTAVDPGGAVAYVLDDRLHDSRGVLHVVTADPRKPAVTARIPLSPGLTPRDLAVDEGHDRLYVANGTHSVVLDVTAPAAPQVIGRIADVMIAAHDRIDLATIADDTFGWRTFLTVRTDFVGGGGCRAGDVHVIDVTGRLMDAPIEILQTPVVTGTATGEGPCPEPQVVLRAADRELDVIWSADGEVVGTDSAAYDITAAFQATATVCRLVRVQRAPGVEG